MSNPGGFIEGVSLDNLLVVEPRPRNPGLTHHNSDTGSYGKFRIPSKPRLLPYSFATFR